MYTDVCKIVVALLVAGLSGVFSKPAIQQLIGPTSAKHLSRDAKPRILYIRSVPGVTGVQSDLYEVHQTPYAYTIGSIQAVAVIQGEGEAAIKGELEFTQRQPPIGPVMITGNITGLTPGLHGIHIHQAGDMRAGCSKLGHHFNPYLLQHGGPLDPLRHVGDLGNIKAEEDGTAKVLIIDPLLSLSSGPRGVVGRSIVITKDEDDFGRTGTADSLTTGSSGDAVACGVIAYIR